MLKLEIKFNDAQMRAEHKYAPESIYAALDKSFTKYGFRRETLSDGTICYYGNGMPRDYGTFGRLITTLKDKEWFWPTSSSGFGTIVMTVKMRWTSPWRMFSITMPTVRVLRNGEERSQAF